MQSRVRRPRTQLLSILLLALSCGASRTVGADTRQADEPPPESGDNTASEFAAHALPIESYPFEELADDPVGNESSPQFQTTWNNGLVFHTAGDAFRFHLGGRMEVDSTWYHQDPNLLLGSSSPGALQDGAAFRRARLRADGTVWEWIDYVFEVNFANIQDVGSVDNSSVPVGSVGLTDMYLTFKEIPLVGNARIGHVKAPLSLERSSSANALYWMERSSLFDAFLSPNQRGDGVVVFNSYLDDRMTLASSWRWINPQTQQSFGFGAQDGSYDFNVRWTGLPICSDDQRTLLHLGVGYNHSALIGNTFSSASRPLVRAGAGPSQVLDLVHTGKFFSPNGGDLIDFELAMIAGPASLSAECAIASGTDVFDTYNGLVYSGPRGDVTYCAFYVEGGYFLTRGDCRRFDKTTAVWAKTIPERSFRVFRNRGCRGGPGAIQFLARYTYLDLVSGDPPLSSTTGGAVAGIQKDVSIGLNWYLNPMTHFMINYVFTNIDSVVAGASGDVSGLGCRMHFDF